MYDAGKILSGLVIFLGLISFPAWYNQTSGKALEKPKLELPKNKSCVESKEYMIANHMVLLYDWREMVVREGRRVYIAKDGKKYDISLTNTCLKCHTRAKFCNKCHDYTGVKSPYCWDCHFDPKEGK